MINPNQSIGTLVGLRNKLVLKGNGIQKFLIPEGSVTYAKAPELDHISVTVGEGTTTKIRTYQLDRTLYRLEGNGSLQS
jgi:hypothetical protein